MNIAATLGIVRDELATNKAFHQWFELHSTAGLLVCAAACTNVQLLDLFRCQVLGSDSLNAPVSDTVVARTRTFGLLNDLVEDLPQLIIQIYVSTAVGDGVTGIVLLSIMSTCVSLFVSILKRTLYLCVRSTKTLHTNPTSPTNPPAFNPSAAPAASASSPLAAGSVASHYVPLPASAV